MTPARLTLASQTYADRVIDVRQENLAQEVKGVTEGRGADAVIVAVSSASAAESGLSALRRGGAFNMFAGTSEGTGMSLDLKKLHYDEWRLTGSFGAAPTHLQKAIDLLSAGSVDVAPLITGRFPFERSLDAVDHMMGLIGMKAVVLFE
jgi:L-iditol 2-dehydrogenase